MGVEDASIPLFKKWFAPFLGCQVPVSFGDGRFLGHSTWFYPFYADSRQKRIPGLVPKSLLLDDGFTSSACSDDFYNWF